MNRREFMLRLAALVAGIGVARAARGQGPVPAPVDSAKADSTQAPPSVQELPPITIAAGGDVVLGYNLQNHFDEQVAAGMTKEQLWPLYFAGTKPILEAADIAIVNLECPFTERGKKLKKNFNFRARPELVRILKEGSVDVVTMANNHGMDYGKTGLKDTMETLDEAGILRFGAGTNLAKARQPLIVEHDGIKVGFLGYYFQADPDMLEPEEVYATKKHAGISGCYKDRECIKALVEEDVKALVPQVDAVIPFFHWGKEGSYEVRDYQMELAHLCVDLGARAVLGAHPHRVQGVEVYKDVPIFYSLGNYVYGGIKEPSDTLTMLARIKIGHTIEAEIIPVQFTRWPEAPFQPFVLEGTARDDAMKRIAEYSRSFVTPLPQLAPWLGDQQERATSPGG